MTAEVHGAFRDIVLEGTLADKGMAGFADSLSDEEAESIRHFLIREANALKSAQQRQGLISDGGKDRS